MNLTPQRAGRLAVAALVASAALGAAPAIAAGPPVPAPTPIVGLPVLPTPVLPIPTPTPSPGLPGVTVPTLPVPGPVDPAIATGTVATAPAPEHPTYQPSPDEQSSLPDEPDRLAYEQQQLDTTTDSAAFDATLGGIAIGAGGGTGRFGWPVVVPAGQKAPITQRFGCTDLAGEPYKAECPSKRWHSGLDLAEPKGTPVFAADSGVVRVYSSSTGYGNHILLVHGNGYATLYGHLSSFAVTDGQVVKRGEMIGQVGSTGFSTGPHLHFEIRYQADYIDPCAEIKC
ncbi:MAG TPA: peptidoglycan DD-metalloendopeptidase family protein [Candidatus Dormibacteraeota bacterium]